MGYFTAGVVLTSEPQWDRLNSLPSPLGFRGYAHSSQPIWLCDFWCGHPLPNYPFQDGGENYVFESFEGNAQIQRFSQLVSRYDEIYGEAWLRAAHKLAGLWNQRVFLFGADDELCDFACCADGTAILSLALNVEQFRIELDGNDFIITPRTDPEDDFEDDAGDQLDELSTLDFVRVLPTQLHERGLFENPVELWPQDAGNPKKIAGIGTWDPLDNLDQDFRVVFERQGVPFHFYQRVR